jgi:hypothetical protein
LLVARLAQWGSVYEIEDDFRIGAEDYITGNAPLGDGLGFFSPQAADAGFGCFTGKVPFRNVRRLNGERYSGIAEKFLAAR